MSSYRVNHIQQLESEAIFVLREVAAQFDNPVMMFRRKGLNSDGSFGIKSFHPAKLPFPLLHVDTGHNFVETINYIDEFVKSIDARLIVAKVQDSIDQGRVIEEKGQFASRNALQTVTLLDALEEGNYDAALGGGRRVEEKARAKERVFSHRDSFGQWDPKNQRRIMEYL